MILWNVSERRDGAGGQKKSELLVGVVKLAITKRTRSQNACRHWVLNEKVSL